MGRKSQSVLVILIDEQTWVEKSVLTVFVNCPEMYEPEKYCICRVKHPLCGADVVHLSVVSLPFGSVTACPLVIVEYVQVEETPPVVTVRLATHFPPVSNGPHVQLICPPVGSVTDEGSPYPSWPL